MTSQIPGIKVAVLSTVIVVMMSPAARGQTRTPELEARIRELRGPVPPPVLTKDEFPGVSLEVSERTLALLQGNHAAEIAALADDDPVLINLYMNLAHDLGDVSDPSRFIGPVEMDMRRRGERAVNLLQAEYANPQAYDRREKVLRVVLHRPWLKPWEFMPLIRKRYQQLQKEKPESASYHMGRATSFAQLWGFPEDLPMLKAIAPLAPRRLFEKRLELLANGQPFTDPSTLLRRGDNEPRPAHEVEQTLDKWEPPEHLMRPGTPRINTGDGNKPMPSPEAHDHPAYPDKTTLWLSLGVAMLALGALVWRWKHA